MRRPVPERLHQIRVGRDYAEADLKWQRLNELWHFVQFRRYYDVERATGRAPTELVVA